MLLHSQAGKKLDASFLLTISFLLIFSLSIMPDERFFVKIFPAKFPDDKKAEKD